MKNGKQAATLTLVAAVLVLGGLPQIGCSDASDRKATIEILIEPFPALAEGEPPPAPEVLSFPALEHPRLLWITGFRIEMLTQDGSPATSVPSFRTDVGFEYVRHARIHGLPVYHTDRLFTLTSRQTALEFPEGFGMPFYSDESFTVSTKLLGASATGRSANLREKVVLEYVLDQDLDEPMKPLFASSGNWVRSEDGTRQRILRLPYDTHAHYITAPLHPSAASASLLDLSSGEVVYDTARDGGAKEATVEDVAYRSGADGVSLLADRSYRIVDDRGDTATAETDTSAPLLLYLRDKLFKKRPRQRAPVAHFDEPIKTSSERLLLHTDRGDIEIAFYPEVAPRHFRQILELARLGVYDGMVFHRVEPDFLVQLGFPEQRKGPPLTPEQSAALRRLEAEFSDLPMKRWTVAMALRDNADPDSAVASFFILLEEARWIDQQYTIVGRVISGLGTLNSIANRNSKDGTPLEPAFIEKAEVKTVAEMNAERVRRSGRSP